MKTEEIQNLTTGRIIKFINEKDAPVYQFVKHGNGVRWYFTPIENHHDVRCSIRTNPIYVLN